MLVVDLEGDAPANPTVDQGLFRSVVDNGLLVLPGFYGVELPKGARVGWMLDDQHLAMQDELETTLLRVPRPAVDPVWEAAALRLRGTMTLIGWNLGADPDQTPKELCDLLDAAACAGRLAGAIVGVAERKVGLPLFFS
jgi:hypothetical protein